MEDNEDSRSWTQNLYPSQTAVSVPPRPNVGECCAAVSFLQVCDQIIADCQQDQISRTDATIQLFHWRDDEWGQSRFESIENLNCSIRTYINSLDEIIWENAQAACDVGTRWQIIDNNDESDDGSSTRKGDQLDGNNDQHHSDVLPEWQQWKSGSYHLNHIL